MGWLRRLGPFGGATAFVLAAAVPAHAAVGGALKFVGCYEGHSGALGAGCIQADALTGIARMALDDQGRNVYATARTASASGNALALFDRDPVTGALTQKSGGERCFSAPGNSEGCTALGTSLTDNPLRGAVDVVVTHDGRNVYTAGSGGVLAEFSRNTAGDLSYLGCIASPQAAAALAGSGCTTGNGLRDPVSIAVDPTDHDIYVASESGLIGALQRLPDGTLVQPAVIGTSPWCVSSTGADDNGTAGKCVQSGMVSDPTQVAVTPDGKQLIVASQGLNTIPASISALDRDVPNGGSLHVPAGPFAAGTGRCVSIDGSADTGSCLSLARLNGPERFALNADGSRIYVAARNGAALLTINRDASAAVFALHAGTSGCVFNGPVAADCSYGDGMAGVYDVATADGGRSVYATALDNHTITAYDVTGDGGLTQKPPPFGCIAGAAAQNCTKLITDSAVEAIVASPDGRNVYAALNNAGSDDRILAFAVDRPPTCNPLNASTAFNTAVTVQLACPDSDSDPTTYAIVNAPAQGTLTAIQPDGTVTYTPTPGASGADPFTFHAITPIVTAPGATAASLATDPTTVTINVAAQQTSTPTPRITSPVAKKWAAGKRFTKVLKLVVSDVPNGAAVRLTCKGGNKRGCPFKSKRVPIAGGTANAGRLLKKAKLRPAAVLELWITKPGSIGRAVRYTIRRSKPPAIRTLCLPAGSNTPSAC